LAWRHPIYGEGRGGRNGDLTPRQAPRAHLTALALLCLQNDNRKVLDLGSLGLLQGHAPRFDGALLVRDHGIDKRQVKRLACRIQAIYIVAMSIVWQA
jgi:hypothetical protein